MEGPNWDLRNNVAAAVDVAISVVFVAKRFAGLLEAVEVGFVACVVLAGAVDD